MAQVSGTVEDETGTVINGATVIAIRESDGAVAGVTTTDGSGEFLISELSESETFHVAASYNDGSTDYGGRSFPFVDPFVATGPIDDFEDNDIAEYSGDLTSFSVQSGTVHEGSFALEMGNDAGSLKEILSQSGLPRYPNVGDTFSYRLYFEGDSGEGAMTFGVQDIDNKYRARVLSGVDEIHLGKVVGGSRDFLASDFAAIPTGEWLEAQIVWGDASEDNPIQLTVFDSIGNELGSASAVDDEFTSGGVGWQAISSAFSGDAKYFDLAQLTNAAEDEPTVTGIVDSFEDGDLSEYGAISSDKGSESVTSSAPSPIPDGSLVLRIDNSSGSTHNVVSTSGLDVYPSAGDTFRWNTYSSASGDRWRIYFGTQTEERNPNTYEVRYGSNDSLSLVINGTSFASTSIGNIHGEWLEFEVQWGAAGDFVVTMWDESGSQIAQISGSDSTYSSGGIGWRFGQTNASTGYADYMRIIG